MEINKLIRVPFLVVICNARDLYTAGQVNSFAVRSLRNSCNSFISLEVVVAFAPVPLHSLVTWLL